VISKAENADAKSSVRDVRIKCLPVVFCLWTN
jgi:hypothetical protein